MAAAADFVRYLTAKRSVDDRALNRVVLETLRAELDTLREADSLHVIDVGGGIGTMLARLVEWRMLRSARYTLIDADATMLSAARLWLDDWARRVGGRAEPTEVGLRLELSHGVAFDVRFVRGDVAHAASLEALALAPADLLIANAVLDLLDVPRVLPVLWRLSQPSALFWFAINFDGETIFLPEHPSDAELLRVYHRTMDLRVRQGLPSGDSKTGRRLFGHLHASGASVLRAGASDWVVHPSDARYPGDESYFLEFIVQTVHQALVSVPEVDAAALNAWTRARRDQIARGELTYIAHQLDFVGRAPARREPDLHAGSTRG